MMDNHICKGHAATWYGEGGVAKSLAALHLSLTISAENQDYWMGFAVKTVPVLYVDFELDADEQHCRALQLRAGMSLPQVPQGFHYLSAAGLPPVEAFGAAAEECEWLGVGLTIVDSVGFALEGDSELSRDVLGFYRECLQPLKDAGASPLLLDHQAKLMKGEKYSDKQAFGSVYKTTAVRSAFQIRGSWDQNLVKATFTHKKNNFGWKEKDFTIEVAFEEERIEVKRLPMAEPNSDHQPSKKEQVFATIKEMGRATAEGVRDKTGLELKTVRNAITDLVGEGALKDTEEKEGRSRIVVPGSRPTKGTGTGNDLEEEQEF
jgi:hypothetical protein